MTIQYEVVIWTLINFALLCAVLHFLLFKPMLKTMDARQSKIDRGRAKLQKAKETAELAAKAQAAATEAAEREMRARAAAEYSEAAKQCEEQRLSAEAESKMLFSQKCSELAEEEERITATLTAAVPTLSKAIAKKLTEKGL